MEISEREIKKIYEKGEWKKGYTNVEIKGKGIKEMYEKYKKYISKQEEKKNIIMSWEIEREEIYIKIIIDKKEKEEEKEGIKYRRKKGEEYEEEIKKTIKKEFWETLKMNYILKGYPRYEVKTKIKELEKLIKEVNNKEKIYEEEITKQAKIEGIEKEGIKVRELYEIWKNKIEKEEDVLYKIKQEIESEKENKEKQKEIRKILKNKEYTINENNIYKKNEEIKEWQKEFIKKIEKTLENYEEITKIIFKKIITKKYLYICILDAIITSIRLYKKNTKQEIEWEEKENIKNEVELTEGFIKQNIYQLIKYNIITYKLPKKMKEKKFKNEINEINEKTEEKEIIKNLKEIIKETKRGYKKASIKWYEKNSKEIEIIIKKMIERVIDILYEIKIFTNRETKQEEEKKKQNILKISDKFLKVLIKIKKPFQKYVLPEIIKPKENKLDEINYIYNNKNIKPNVNKEYLKIINQMQGEEYRINKEYLKNILELPLKYFQEITKMEWLEYYEDIKNNTINWEKYKNKQEIYIMHEYCEIIYIAEIYKKYKEIYFKIKIDSRFRKYIEAYPLNFIGTKIFRMLITFGGEEEKISYKQEIKNYKKYEEYIKENISKVKYEEQYQFLNVLKEPKKSLIGLDATSQVFQILGGLILDKKLLKYTKVLEGEEKGLYEYIEKEMKTELEKKEAYYKKINEIIKEKHKKLKEQEMLKYYTTEEIQWNNINTTVDRNFIKNILMTYGYNKTLIKLIETGHELLYQEEEKKYANNKIKKYNKKISNIIVKKILEIFNREFPGLENLKKIFINVARLSYYYQEPLIINLMDKFTIEKKKESKSKSKYEIINGYLYFLQFYYVQEIEKINKYIGNREKGNYRKYVTIYCIKEKTKELNLKKQMKALLPNTTHSIDAYICMNVYNILKQQEIRTITLHDSFYVYVKDIEQVKEAYKEMYLEMFRKNRLIIIINNILTGLKLNNEFSKFIKKYEEEGSSILKILERISKEKSKEKKEAKIIKILKELYEAYKKIESLKIEKNHKKFWEKQKQAFLKSKKILK